MSRLAALAVLLALAACKAGKADLGEGLSGDATGGGSGGGAGGGDSGGIANDTGDPVEDPDEDGDGYTVGEGDCDDTDPDVHPGGDEGDEADGIDQDCDGTADDRTVCDDGLGDYATIQEGIDDAPAGFVLLVCPGEYPENLLVSERPVTLRSTGGPEVTTIVAAVAGPTITVADVEDVAIEGFTVTGGVAEYGGGIFGARATLSLSDDAIGGNVATVMGGGVMLYRCHGSVSGSVVAGNEAPEGGGLVAWEGEVEIDGNTVQGNVATTTAEDTYGSGSGGGGILVYGDSPVRNNTVAGNTSYYNGGGIYVLYGAGEITGNTVSGNLCGEDGGGVYTNQSSAEFSGNVVEGNEAYDDAGGVRVYVGSMTITDNDLLDNVAADDAGGMKLSHASNVIARNHFEGNSTGDAGGGMEMDNESSDVSDCTFVGNTAWRGGGLHSWRNEDEIVLEGLVFQDNAATDCGGAIQFDNDPYTVHVRHMQAFGNTADDGGAVCIDLHYVDDAATTWYDSAVSITNSLIVENVVVDDGGAFYVKEGTLSAVNNTIVGNEGGQVAFLAVKQASAEIVNNIVAGNAGPQVVYGEDADVEYSYNDFWDNDGEYVGVRIPRAVHGNIESDPGFVGGGDWSLAPESPCIDAGDPTLEDTDGSRADIGFTGGPDGT